MIEQARRLNSNIIFSEGNMLALDLHNESLAGIACFYAIVNLPRESLLPAFREVARVLQPDGILLLAFHVGNETICENELWGHKISMDFTLFLPSEIRQLLKQAGLVVEETIERDAYPNVEYPSRRAYIFARKPDLP